MCKCSYCDMGQDVINIVETWADDGLNYTRMKVLSRPSALTHPNTFVFVFENAVTVNGASKDIWLDAHYTGDRIEGGKALIALGGLWIKGVKGAMKPEQHGGELRRVLKANVPGNAPKPPGDGTYGVM